MLCHDTGCEGHDHRAGSHPTGRCKYCGRPLADGYGVLLVEPESGAPLPVDLVAVGVCSAHGHVWEGHHPPGTEEFRGACSRCGLGITLCV